MNDLFKKVRGMKYPDGVRATDRVIEGTAFFPGGRGLWLEDRDHAQAKLPVSGIMVLGHNFDSTTGYEASVSRKKENLNGPTWRNLIKLLEEAKIPLNECFFTNFYMGVIDGTSSTGKFPGAKDRGFVDQCRQLFTEQIRLQKPSVIFVLGTAIPRLISSMSGDLSPWAKATSLKKIDEKGALFTKVLFTEADHTCAVVSLVHPSYRQRNITYRTQPGMSGNEYELSLIKKARKHAGR